MNFIWDLLSVVIMCYVSLDLEPSFWMVDHWAGVMNYHITCFWIQKVPPWLPEGNGKILHEWSHQRQDHSVSRINPNHCKASAAAAIPASGKPLTGNQWHWWYLIYSHQNKSLSCSQSLSPQVSEENPQDPKYHEQNLEHGVLQQQGGPGDFIPLACSWAAWFVGPNI